MKFYLKLLLLVLLILVIFVIYKYFFSDQQKKTIENYDVTSQDVYTMIEARDKNGNITYGLSSSGLFKIEDYLSNISIPFYPYVKKTGSGLQQVVPITFIHRINLKNFMLQTSKNEFSMSTSYNPALLYEFLYKINYWSNMNIINANYMNNGITMTNDTAIFSVENTGFNSFYLNSLNSTSGFSNNYMKYITNFRSQLTKILGSDYYTLITNFNILNDFYVNGFDSTPGSTPGSNPGLKPGSTPGSTPGSNPGSTNKLYDMTTGLPLINGSEKIGSYRDYVKKITTDTTFSDVLNNYAKQYIKKVTIDGTYEYNIIFSIDTPSVNSSTTTSVLNDISNNTANFFKHFYILHTLASIRAERYYVNDKNYYNLSSTSYSPFVPVNTLNKNQILCSYDKTKKAFVNGESFTRYDFKDEYTQAPDRYTFIAAASKYNDNTPGSSNSPGTPEGFTTIREGAYTITQQQLEADAAKAAAEMQRRQAALRKESNTGAALSANATASLMEMKAFAKAPPPVVTKTLAQLATKTPAKSPGKENPLQDVYDNTIDYTSSSPISKFYRNTSYDQLMRNITGVPFANLYDYKNDPEYINLVKEYKLALINAALRIWLKTNAKWNMFNIDDRNIDTSSINANELNFVGTSGSQNTIITSDPELKLDVLTMTNLGVKWPMQLLNVLLGNFNGWYQYSSTSDFVIIGQPAFCATVREGYSYNYSKRVRSNDGYEYPDGLCKLDDYVYKAHSTEDGSTSDTTDGTVNSIYNYIKSNNAAIKDGPVLNNMIINAGSSIDILQKVASNGNWRDFVIRHGLIVPSSYRSNFPCSDGAWQELLNNAALLVNDFNADVGNSGSFESNYLNEDVGTIESNLHNKYYQYSITPGDGNPLQLNEFLTKKLAEITAFKDPQSAKAVSGRVSNVDTYNNNLINYNKIHTVDYKKSFTTVWQKLSSDLNYNNNTVYPIFDSLNLISKTNILANQIGKGSVRYRVTINVNTPEDINKTITTMFDNYIVPINYNKYSTSSEANTIGLKNIFTTEQLMNIITPSVPGGKTPSPSRPNNFYDYSMIVSKLNSNDGNNMYSVDMLYLLNYIFENNSYKKNKDFNVNRIYTMLYYNIENIVKIDYETDPDPLSDKNFERLNINNRIDSFFDFVKAKITKDTGFYNFYSSEKQYISAITAAYDPYYSNELVTSNDILKNLPMYTYSTDYLSIVNYLVDLYNSDLVYVVIPIFNQVIAAITSIQKQLSGVDYAGSIDTASFLSDARFSDFIKKYSTNPDSSTSFLNRGLVFDKSVYDFGNEVIKDTTNFPKVQSGLLNMLLNYHHLAYNLLLRVLYYYKKYSEILLKYNSPLNDFTQDKLDILLNGSPPLSGSIEPLGEFDKIKIMNNIILSENGNLITKQGYENNINKFLGTYLNFFNNTMCDLIYKQIRYNVSVFLYEIVNSENFFYKTSSTASSSKGLTINTGAQVKQTFLLFSNMYNSVKNSQKDLAYLSTTYTSFFAGTSFVDRTLTPSKNDKGIDFVKKNLEVYINTVFYFNNATLYGCFGDNDKTMLNSMGLSNTVNIAAPGQAGNDTPSGNYQYGDTPTVISNVNNYDSEGILQKYGAVSNCINNTVAYNYLNKKNFDIISLKPLQTSDSNIDMYTCYAGTSAKFNEAFPDGSAPNLDINKCTINYLDSSGVKQAKTLNSNLNNNTVIYKIDSVVNYPPTIVPKGCFARNVPELGIYNTLPHFIGNIPSSESYTDPGDLIQKAANMVDKYNSSFNTHHDVFGLTNNMFDSLTLDVYAGTYKFDANYAFHAPKDVYQPNCNVYNPGSDNFMIFQKKELSTDACIDKQVSNLQNYNDLLTAYLKVNVNTQQNLLNQMQTDVNMLDNLFPIKFSISGISNSKVFSDISVNYGFKSSPSSDKSSKTCYLNLTLKEGPPGSEGNKGNAGIGKNTVGAVGADGNAGYWGATK